MVTKKTDIERDMAFGQIVMIVATPEEDMKENTDLFWRGLRVAWRTRKISLDKYKQISIRNCRYSGTVTEKEKILSGQSKAHIYVFEFKDYYVICLVNDIRNELLKGKGVVKKNPDRETEAIYIPVKNIPCLITAK